MGIRRLSCEHLAVVLCLVVFVSLSDSFKFQGFKPMSEGICPAGRRCSSSNDLTPPKVLVVNIMAEEDPYVASSVQSYLFDHIWKLDANPQLIFSMIAPNSVISIGMNQNPYKEIRMNLLREDGIPVMRRISGGGAVFLDRGGPVYSLYFPLSMKEDIAQQFQGATMMPTIPILLPALQKLGVPCTQSGRNDIVADGRKVSGSAFYEKDGKGAVSSSLLFDVNLTKLARYLSPSRAKLEAKGIKSVEARVVNLKYNYPDLTLEKITDAVIESFLNLVPNMDVEFYEPDMDELYQNPEFNQILARKKDPEYIFGSSLEFSIQLHNRFSWGQFEVQIQSEGKSIISDVKIFSDCLIAEIPNALKLGLTGVSYSPEGVKQAIEKAKSSLPLDKVEAAGPQLEEFGNWLAKSL